MKPNFDLPEEELELVKEIAKRACRLCPELDPVSVAMDVTVTHNHTCRLRLKNLLEADDFNFTHDIMGIETHLDRDNLKLMHCFWPRFAGK